MATENLTFIVMLYRLNNIKFQMLTQAILQYYKLVKDLKISCHLTVTVSVCIGLD